jgi:hypothetical protein
MKRLIIFEDSGQEQVVEKLLAIIRHRVTFDSSEMAKWINFPGEILPEDVTLIRMHKSKTMICDSKGFETESEVTIDKLLSQFNSRFFLKVSPTIAINLVHLEEVGFSPPAFLKLTGGTRISLSEDVAKLFIRHLNQISK